MLVVVTEYSGTTLNRMQFSEQLKQLPLLLREKCLYYSSWHTEQICRCLSNKLEVQLSRTILLAAVVGPWSHYSRACSVGSQGEKGCSSRCSLPCHFHPPRSEGPSGGMSNTTADTIASIGHLLGQGFPSSSPLPKMRHPLDFLRPASVDIYVFACSVTLKL